MKIVKIFFLFFILALIIWIDLPENLKVDFTLGKQKVDFKVNPFARTHLGLDLKGGSHLVFEADTSKVRKEDLQDALNSARDIVEKRVNLFGVAEPLVQTVKSADRHRITVDLPGVTNVSDAIRLIGTTAQLSFAEIASQEGELATSSAILKPTILTGKHIKKALLQFNPQDAKPEVGLEFSQEGGRIFAEITKRNIGKPLAILVDNFPITSPIVQQEIPDGKAVITGTFTVDEAKKLAIAINSGALPLPLILVEQRNIGPTLGRTEVQKSVFAGIVGLCMVILFMILYYGKFGLIASIGLAIFGLISLAIIRTIPIVLTLPGVAGLILSIGMAVDSNILIFERIKEELRRGNDLDISIRLGFGRAIDAIKDANITTLIVAFILFNPLNWEFLPQFGLVRGFALTLAIGVGTSLFTGVVITKRLINIFYKQK